MLYSKKLKLLFVACPKTGSTSVEAALLKLDPEGQRFALEHGGRTYTSADVDSGSLGHATALEFQRILGAEAFATLRVFGFVRDPREKLVSTYFFKRKGSIWNSLFKTKGSKRVVNTIRSVGGILLARLLPFALWARLWPMKQCAGYFYDGSDNLLVNYLGSTNRLGKDLTSILAHCGITGMQEAEVPHVNKSIHQKPDEYFSPSLNRYVEKKYAPDIALFRLVESGLFIREYEGLVRY